MSSRPTIREVAARAGVSATTVSHVLSGHGRVAPATEAKVRAAVRELGYRPHPGARSLRTETYGAVGLLLPTHVTSFEFYADLAMGAAEAAFEAGKSLILVPPAASKADMAALAADALVVVDPIVDDDRVSAFAAHGGDVVYCEQVDRAVRWVGWDYEKVVGQLMDHLVAQGCSRLVVLSSDSSVWWGINVERAVQRSALRHKKLWVQQVTMPFVASESEVKALVDQCLADPPDALVVFQEGMAPVLLACAADRGLDVPDDLLIAVGVDARDARTAHLPVTALDLHARECGRLAIESLDRPVGHLAPVELQLRASTARVDVAGEIPPPEAQPVS